jgi:hypothetical protein
MKSAHPTPPCRRRLWAFVALGLLCSCVSAIPPDRNPVVYQRYPSTLFKDGVATLVMQQLHDQHPVGIICSDAVWQVLLAHRDEFRATVDKSTNDTGALYGQIGDQAMQCDRVKNCHFLFGIDGLGDATVTIHLPPEVAARPGVTFDIVLLKNSDQMDLVM